MNFSYYNQRFLPLLAFLGITHQHSKNEVVSRLNAAKRFISKEEIINLKAFVNQHWKIERHVLKELSLKGFDFNQTSDSNFMADPALNLENIPVSQTENNIHIMDMTYPKCPKCFGRIFSEFNYCPFCGLSVNPTTAPVSNPTPVNESVSPVIENIPDQLPTDVILNQPTPNTVVEKPHWRQRLGLPCPKENVFIPLTQQMEATLKADVIINEEELGKVTAFDIQKTMKGIEGLY